MEKESLASGLPSIGLPFSWGIKLGHLVFLAGQGPIGKDGKVIEGDVRVQTQETLENFRRVLESGGSSLDHVLSTTVYLSNLEDFSRMNEVYSEYFAKEPRPARATVRADLLFGMKVEIQGIAYVPEQEETSRPAQSTPPETAQGRRRSKAHKRRRRA